ncbi:dihydropteroate synthase [Deltaproteobacteria bacterium TL4]
MFEQNTPSYLTSKNKKLSLNKKHLIGILNITSDSFSDGGHYLQSEHAIAHAFQMIEEGADWIDIGAESSGPGSQEISAEQEMERILPVLHAIRQKSDLWLSIDTWKANVARCALEAGADVINDVTALRGDPAMAEVLAETQCPVILMYSKDPTARTTTASKDYEDVLETLSRFFQERIEWMQKRGIQKEQIILDPGMGFFISAKAKYSFQIIQRLHEMITWGYPLLLGPSRKSFLAQVSPEKTLALHERELPGLVVGALALKEGAHFLRMHNTAQARLMMDTFMTLQNA